MNDQEYAAAKQEAMDGVVAKLAENTGYFNWEHLGEGLFRRTPRTDKPEAEWLKSEKPVLVHICKPIKLMEFIEAGQKDRTIACSSYVIDGKCARCNFTTEVTS